jgi:hypothetical protein
MIGFFGLARPGASLLKQPKYNESAMDRTLVSERSPDGAAA